MNITYKIICSSCHTPISKNSLIEHCPQCGNNWLDIEYSYHTLHHWPDLLSERGASLWRYHELLPIHHQANIISFGEGWTPLYHAQNLGLMLGHPHIYIKDERQGPTGSFKDRQASIAVSAMKEAGIKEAVVASTGNVAIAYSAYCARAGIKLWVFVTSSVPADKMREVALYGSEVIKVAGTYDQAKQIAAEFARSKNLFLDRGLRNLAAREAMKTIAFEIAEQLGTIFAGHDASLVNGNRFPWRAPDWYLQAVSGGLGPVGVMKGFQELQALGLIEKMPKLGIFQVSGCAPMVSSFEKGLTEAEDIEQPITDIATLATGKPGKAYQVLRELILTYGGTMTAVTDGEAFRALKLLAQMDGISVEPATAVTIAGLIKLIRQGVISPHETVIVNCSGHTFPVEKHIVGEQYARDMLANANSEPHGREEGILTALEEIDGRIQRIAIIEDNLDSSRLLRRILQAQGDFLIEEAHNGTEGLALIQRTRPNLVILDLMMPGMDGFAIVEAMKNDPNLRHIPVIVVTAKELSAIERARLSGKIKALWQKGAFLDSDLLQEIKEALPKT